MRNETIRQLLVSAQLSAMKSQPRCLKPVNDADGPAELGSSLYSRVPRAALLIWDWIILCCRAVSCTVGCLPARPQKQQPPAPHL